MSNNLRAQLREFEGVVPYAYQDQFGYWTIGVGRLIDKRKGGHLSDEEIDFLLDNDIKRVAKEVIEALPWVAHMTEARQAVVLGMAFQMGLHGLLGFTGTLASMRDEHYADAAEGMRLSQWAKQTPQRVHKMAYQMESGEWQTVT